MYIMKKFILNPNKILENEIDEEVTRVKALIINSNNEILLACLYNEYQRRTPNYVQTSDEKITSFIIDF